MSTMRIRFAAVITSIPFCILGNPVGHGQPTAEATASAVLFRRFEAVAYSRTDLLSELRVRPQGQVDGTNYLELPYAEWMEGLGKIGSNAERDLERSYSSLLVGAMEFGGEVGLGPGPDGLGMVNSRKCYVATLESGREPDLRQDFAGASIQTIDEVPVWVWTVPAEGGVTNAVTFYAAQVGGTYFVLANNRPDFQIVITSLSPAGNSAPAVPNVVGWETLSGADYWLYRSFRRAGVTSPDAAGINGLTPDVTTLIFYADAGDKQGFVQVLSSDITKNSAPNVLRKLAPDRFQPQGAGLWQATIQLSRGGADADTMLELLYRFGFGVAL